MKPTIQLAIALLSLAAALALTATAVYAADCTPQTCELKPVPWKEYRTTNDSPAEFAADWITASKQCGGSNTECIEATLKAKGWTWQPN